MPFVRVPPPEEHPRVSLPEFPPGPEESGGFPPSEEPAPPEDHAGPLPNPIWEPEEPDTFLSEVTIPGLGPGPPESHSPTQPPAPEASCATCLHDDEVQEEEQTSAAPVVHDITHFITVTHILKATEFVDHTLSPPAPLAPSPTLVASAEDRPTSITASEAAVISSTPSFVLIQPSPDSDLNAKRPSDGAIAGAVVGGVIGGIVLIFLGSLLLSLWLTKGRRPRVEFVQAGEGGPLPPMHMVKPNTGLWGWWR